MEAITLPYVAIESENQIKEVAITKEGKVAPSIRLEIPDSSSLSESMLVLNGEQQVKRTQDKQTRNQLLQLHGVPYAQNSSILKEYILFIFQTRVLVMYQSIGQSPWLAMNRKQSLKYRKVPLTDKGKEVKKVQTLAIRALYALGLDYGVVKCGIGAGKKTLVLQVIPSPKCNTDMENAFIKAITQYMKQLKEPKIPLEQIVLGADPEFVMQSSKGHLLIASKYFPMKGKIGCDAIWIGQNHSHKPLVEIRPDPTPDPRTLVVRIYQTLLQAAKKMSHVQAKWLAGAMPYRGFPLGGHIHFSGIQPDFKMLRALDNYLALLLVLVEDENGKARRPKYGFLGDFRYQEYGGFEYRTPPSWLVSPTLTKGVFVTAKLIVANYKKLQYDPLSNPTIQQAYYTGDKATLQQWGQKLWSDLKSCEDYKVYQTYLDEFYRYISSGVTWDEAQDFRIPWRLPPYQKRKQA